MLGVNAVGIVCKNPQLDVYEYHLYQLKTKILNHYILVDMYVTRFTRSLYEKSLKKNIQCYNFLQFPGFGTQTQLKF